MLGWPELAGEALARRGDVEVLAVDALDEGSGLVRRLRHAGVDAVDVPVSGLGAAAAAADLVLLEASAAGPDRLVAVAGSRAAAAVARSRRRARVGGRRRRPPAARARSSPPSLARLEAEHAGEPWEAADEIVPGRSRRRASCTEVGPDRARPSPSPTPTAPWPPSCSGPSPACDARNALAAWPSAAT